MERLRLCVQTISHIFLSPLIISSLYIFPNVNWSPGLFAGLSCHCCPPDPACATPLGREKSDWLRGVLEGSEGRDSYASVRTEGMRLYDPAALGGFTEVGFGRGLRPNMFNDS